MQRRRQLQREFAGYPFLTEDVDLEKAVDILTERYRDDFCVSDSFSARFIEQLMYNGFLPMASMSSLTRGEVLMPKLHQRRSLVLLDPGKRQVHKSTLKKSAKFTFSINTCFEKVCEGIVEQHGQNWFYPKLVEAFVECNRNPRHDYVRVVSFEVYSSNDGKLVAGECGYVCGKVYTSLSGFCFADSAGTVQMQCLHKKCPGQNLFNSCDGSAPSPSPRSPLLTLFE
ncbi:hypothetical protein BASA81_000855 [Batrachochytrium salamandrivorans]|nr:hypothetical protein BASA81_000855 [Batrachochytrium salamandrivorans]